jgi:ATP-dependent Clp protease ATP-binding subunit ClpA
VAVDCTQTIWILATNFGSDAIEDYYKGHVEGVDEKHRHTVDLKPLQMRLKQEYMSRFGVSKTHYTT